MSTAANPLRLAWKRSRRNADYAELGIIRANGRSFPIAALDRADRFAQAHQVQAYLGLVPGESTTGGRRRLSSITTARNGMARWALVQAAQSMLRAGRRAQDPLVLWARQVEARRGKRVAVVALARRLAGILWAMWVDGTFYDAQGLGRASADGLTRRARRAAREARQMQEVARPAA